MEKIQLIAYCHFIGRRQPDCRQKNKIQTMHLLFSPILGSAIIIGGGVGGLLLVVIIVVLLVR
jgi:hypothetical protein